jgi:hypothetical protein
VGWSLEYSLPQIALHCPKNLLSIVNFISMVISTTVLRSQTHFHPKECSNQRLHRAHGTSFCNPCALGVEHLFITTASAYPSWPLILRAWRHIFSSKLEKTYDPAWYILSATGCPAVLLSLIVHARRYGTRKEQFILLIEQDCHKLDEERVQREQDGTQYIQEKNSFGCQGILGLVEQICEMLDASWRGV